MARTLFGTDGIRGIANREPMTPEIALQFGKAVARHFRNGRRPVVVVGKDTRLSGYIFESALTAGLCAAGATVFLVGPLPTPAIAHITKSFAADAGIVITASHNPAEHNGLKLFDAEGYKLPDEQEEAIEQLIHEGLDGAASYDEPIGKAKRIDDARGRYIEFAKATIGSQRLKGLRVVLDCANGAAYSVTPVILKELGAEVIVLNDKPNGTNINEGCGATHPEVIRDAVLRHSADIGVALDGDADRVIMVDEQGNDVNGDHILAMCALDLHQRGLLARETVVVTDYTNLGFDETLAKKGIMTIRVRNGDRYVIEAMREHGYVLGGEQSGHIIFGAHGTTGDGTIAALQVLRIMHTSEQPLSALARCFTAWPQLIRAVHVREKRPLESLPAVQKAIKEAEQELSQGRVFVRYSGTESKMRILVEGKNETIVKKHADAIEAAAKQEVGA
ncbi:phosphoglucosamine mutase [Candidatus Woesearchaeota archaeon]|nr:MAG: phosphoglucosamine mutase [Candidatus Woesearchaeota archaeon]